MIRQFKILTRVKSLREDSALKKLQQSKKKLKEATEEYEQSKAVFDESKRTYAKRENIIYDSIIGKSVGLDKIEEVKKRVAELEDQHLELYDRMYDAEEAKEDAEEEMEECRDSFMIAQRNHNKFQELEKKMVTNFQKELSLKEEKEIEELFSKGKGSLEEMFP